VNKTKQSTLFLSNYNQKDFEKDTFLNILKKKLIKTKKNEKCSIFIQKNYNLIPLIN